MERTDGSVIRGLLRRKKSTGEGASGARYGMFVSLRDGMSELHAALLERIRSAGDVRTGTAVTRLEPTGASADSAFRVDTGSGTPDEYDAVIVGIPAWRAADLIESWNEPLARDLRGIEYASSAIVVSGHRLEDIAHPLDAAGLVIPAIERRRILAVSFLSRKFPNRAPEGRVILRTFVGGATQPELMSDSDDELRELVRAELRDVLAVGGEPEFMEVVRWERAMPQYHVGHLDRVRGIERQCASLPGFELAGNAYRGVGIPDCIHDGELAAERIWTANGGREPAD
jgi:oxygen-dependent protoporphyrinogen oxidase